LKSCLDAGYPIVGVITAPDKPGGRGLKHMNGFQPVKSFAMSRGLNILQPTNLKAKKFPGRIDFFEARSTSGRCIPYAS
jgi:methionyl-tRNA formyltransferase